MRVQDLLNYPLLHLSTETKNWQHWFESAGVEYQVPESSISVDTLAVAIEMALNGEGIAIINGPLVEDYLTKGWLVKPVQHTVEDWGHWGLICRKDKLSDPRVERFKKWLLGLADR